MLSVCRMLTSFPVHLSESVPVSDTSACTGTNVPACGVYVDPSLYIDCTYLGRTYCTVVR